MDIIDASKILKELGHPVRLSIIKELIKYGEQGLPVGELQKIVQIPNSTLSHHISSLMAVGLLFQERKGTTLFCVSDNNLVQQVTKFLVDECCSKKR